MIDGRPISVGGRATPDLIDWNGDGKDDLIVGSVDGYIWVFLNVGDNKMPSFSHPSKVMFKDGRPVNVGGRSAPRVFDWDRDGRNDMLIGEVMGYVYFLRNVGTNDAPAFNRAERLRLINGISLKYPVKGARSRLSITDWDNDGIYDLVLGGMDGRVMLFKGSDKPLRIKLKDWIIIRLKERFER